MRVGVTGGAGFIGSHVVDRLIELRHEPVIFDHVRPARARPDIDLMLGDTRDATAVSELGAHVDAIIHLASVLGTQETIGDPIPAATTNVISGLNCLMTARKYDLALVNIAVGNWWMLNTYSQSKHNVEQYVRMFGREFNVRAVNVRCVNAYGPRQFVFPPYGSAKVRKITPSFICRALCEQPIQIYGDGTQVSDMVYVGDVARTLVAAAEHCALSERYDIDHAIEVGPMRSATVTDVANRVLDTVERLGLARRIDNPIEYLPMRPGETADSVLSIEQATHVENELLKVGVDGYTARSMLRPLTNLVSADYRTLKEVKVDPLSMTPLTVGIAQTVAWFSEHRGEHWNDPRVLADAG